MTTPEPGAADPDPGVRVAALHLAPGRRLPTRSVERVQVETQAGIVGDRYHGSRHRQVSVQSLTDLGEAERRLGRPVPPGLTRRNITLDRGAVPRDPGARLRIGPVLLEVVRVAAPCRLLDDGLGPGAAEALRRRAGSICRVLEGGPVRLGDSVEVHAPTDGSDAQDQPDQTPQTRPPQRLRLP